MRNLTRRDFLSWVAGGAAAAALPSALWGAAERAGDAKTNFVIVLCDDLGYADLGCYGSKIIQTPNLDKFAAEGMRFTDCYAAAPLCSPSRAAILTGRMPHRSGIYTWIPAGSPMHLKKEEVTVARLLKGAGYATCHVGKWHCNGLFNSPDQPQPGDHGFDHWFSTQNNAGPSHLNPDNFVRNGRAVGPTRGYSSTIIVDEAIRWLGSRGDKDQPFFLFVCFHSPHEPVATGEEFMKPYAGQEGAIYYGNVSQMDHEFGRLMKTLDEMRLRENTLVMFTSDNGPSPKGNCRYPFGSAGPLRGKKLHVHEGGIREPGIIRWPGKIKPAQVSHEPICGTDVLPTLCEIAAVKPPADRVIDGVSILGAFEGRTLDRKIPLYWRFDGAWSKPFTQAMRQGEWKILADKNLQTFALHNLKDDLAEANDLSANEPQRLKEMSQRLKALHDEIEAEGPRWPQRKQEGKKKQVGPKASGAQERALKGDV